ncbi:MAG: hypothetical protein HUU28_04590 [Planctomycetaceae bacterium]|nr:hypothetical protein [Planctomycetaceae bacterium]
MGRRGLYWFAKTLEGVGMIVVLVGVFVSMTEGFEGRGLESMAYEFQGLMIGGGLFLVGVLIERKLGTR